MKANQRLGYLDSIRGIAAFIVVLHHCWLTNTTNASRTHGSMQDSLASIEEALFYGISKFFESGRVAVIIFFVLSGFVLAYSLTKQPTSYANYIIKRAFRIYPVFIFVILVSYALHRLIGVQHDVGMGWLESVVNPDLSLVALINHFSLWGKESFGLDNVIWSLVPEVRISVIFPFILYSVTKYGWRSLSFYFLVSFACTGWILATTGTVALGSSHDTLAGSLLESGYFIVFFAAGACLAVKHADITRRLAALPQPAKALLFAFVIACLLKGDYNNHTWAGNIGDYVRGLGAAGIIALALGVKKFGNALSHGIFVWLGRISYSLYLVHLPIIYVVNQTFGFGWPPIGFSLVVIGLSIIAAEILARTIEFPSIRLGKALGARFAKNVNPSATSA